MASASEILITERDNNPVKNLTFCYILIDKCLIPLQMTRERSNENISINNDKNFFFRWDGREATKYFVFEFTGYDSKMTIHYLIWLSCSLDSHSASARKFGTNLTPEWYLFYICLIQWPLGDVDSSSNMHVSISIYWLARWVLIIKPLHRCSGTVMMLNQHRIR